MLFQKLNLQDVHQWKAKGALCWNELFWNKSLDKKHYQLWAAIVEAPEYKLWSAIGARRDCKLLYDSYLWRMVIAAELKEGHIGAVIELCHGKSLTIPLALSGMGISGVLDRLDCALEVPLPPVFSLRQRWIRSDISMALSSFNNYDLIVGNHIIDDMLLINYLPDVKVEDALFDDPRFTDPLLSSKIWDELVNEEILSIHAMEVRSTIISVVQQIKRGAVLILRQYPSTFSLLSEDVNQINAQLTVFYALAMDLADIADVDVFFSDIANIPVPDGCKYPRSFLVARKN
jgi:hypothetical protein